MKVFGWLGDHGACAWYRLILPLGALREYDVQTRCSTRIGDMDLDADIVVIQRPTLKGPTMILRKMAVAPERPRIVVELDDDLFSIDEHHRPDAQKHYNNPDTRANIIANLRLADLVTVSTEPLAQQIRQYNPNVVVLPNCIPKEMLTWSPGQYGGRFTVGWQGTSTHDSDWQPAAEPIRRWFHAARKLGLPVELHTIGSVPKTLPDVYPHRHTDGLDDIEAYYRTIDWHVALAPLIDTKFNRSKSHIRVLEASMLRMPSIASDVPAYRGLIEHGKTGFLVKEPREWGEYLQILATDQTLCWEMGQRAYERAGDFTVEGNAKWWLETYQTLLEDK